jgi:hypothetical protein
MGFDVPKALKKKIFVFCDVMHCSLVDWHHRFKEY